MLKAFKFNDMTHWYFNTGTQYTDYQYNYETTNTEASDYTLPTADSSSETFISSTDYSSTIDYPTSNDYLLPSDNSRSDDYILPTDYSTEYGTALPLNVYDDTEGSGSYPNPKVVAGSTLNGLAALFQKHLDASTSGGANMNYNSQQGAPDFPTQVDTAFLLSNYQASWIFFII